MIFNFTHSIFKEKKEKNVSIQLFTFARESRRVLNN